MIKNQTHTILFITHYPGMYGANKSMCRLILELKENYSIRPVVLLRSGGPICEFLDNRNIPYFISHFYWWVYEGKGFKALVLNAFKQVRNFSRIKRIVKTIGNQYQFDFVYTNSITINIGYFLSRKLNCLHIWHIRETIQAYKFRFSLGEKISKYLLKNGADRYIVISNYLKNWYSGLLPEQKVTMIYNGIEPVKPLRQKNKINSTLNLCILGILCDQKNQKEALQALDILINSKHINNVCLHFAGGKREGYFHRLKKYIEQKGLTPYVKFHGHSNDVNGLLKNMNLGIVCARDEGFGRVNIEFMLNLIPVIASNSGANSETIKPGLNGEIYSLGNYQQLAEKIEVFIHNTNLFEEMGHKSQKYALDNFSSQKNSKAIYHVMLELLEIQSDN